MIVYHETKQKFCNDVFINDIGNINTEGNDFLAKRYAKWKDDNNTTLQLISYNKHYKDIIIPASAVQAIALVEIVIRTTSMLLVSDGCSVIGEHLQGQYKTCFRYYEYFT